MERSTLYCGCPGCAQETLVEPVGGTYRCAQCAFDYGALAKDDAARERWMLSNLQKGPWGQLVVLELHRRIMGLAPQASNAQVVAFAARHGITLPTGEPTSPLAIAAVVAVVLVGLIVTVIFVAAR